MPLDEPQASQAKIKVKSFSMLNQNITELDKSNKHVNVDRNCELNDSKFSDNWLSAQNVTDPKLKRDFNYNTIRNLRKQKIPLFNLSAQHPDIEKSAPCCSSEMDLTAESMKYIPAVNQTTAAEWFQNQDNLKPEKFLDRLLDSSE